MDSARLGCHSFFANFCAMCVSLKSTLMHIKYCVISWKEKLVHYLIDQEFAFNFKMTENLKIK